MHGVPLCGHNGAEAHVEIFLPAHERTVRAAEGHIRKVIRKADGKGGKLLFFRRVKQVHIAREPRAAEAGAGRKGGKQARIIRQTEVRCGSRFCGKMACALKRRTVQAVRRRIGKGDGFVEIRRGDPVKGDIGKAAEDQAVRFVKGRLCE